MKLPHFVLVVALSAVTAFAVGNVTSSTANTKTTKETAMDRVLRTGTLRCGYYVFPPATYRDPNTGALSGFSVDFMNWIAGRAGLKVEWTEEVTFGNWTQGLEAGRFDAACTPQWPEIAMLRVVEFTESPLYSSLSPIVRADDERFKDEDLDRLNQPDVTFLGQDGDINERLAREAFPNAKAYTVTAGTNGAELYQSILNKKADAVLADRNVVSQFNKANGNVLRIIAPDRPVKLQSFPLAVARGESGLRHFFDVAIREMIYNGEIDRILRKWEPEPGKTFVRAALPIVPPAKQ